VESARERLGTTLLGKWRLEALLGEGGMAVVYAATHRNGARGAVKMLRSTKPEEVGRFIREGYIANRVDHPSVVRVLDDDVAEDGTPFLVMELLEGKAMDELANERGGRLPVSEVLDAMWDVLDVLAAAHAHGIVHRDIKPENIFITTEGLVKVLDFGIAHLPEGSGPPSSKTQTGLVMGTPAFMSPEQARARWDLVGATSDIWSVGATMFTLLSGQFVHLEQTVPELLAATFTKPARSLKDALPDAPSEVVALVDRALERQSAARWGSASEMHHALESAQAALGLPPRARPRLTSSPSLVRRWHITGRNTTMDAGHVSVSTSLALTVKPQRAWLPKRMAAIAAVDVAMGALVLFTSARTLSAKGLMSDEHRTTSQLDEAVVMTDQASLDLTRPAEDEKRRPESAPPVSASKTTPVEAAPPSQQGGPAADSRLAPTASSIQPSPAAPSSAGTHADAPRRRNIYDRRY
jgi:eukaryotic-like serine/threonine-protein kinase